MLLLLHYSWALLSKIKANDLALLHHLSLWTKLPSVKSNINTWIIVCKIIFLWTVKMSLEMHLAELYTLSAWKRMHSVIRTHISHQEIWKGVNLSYSGPLNCCQMFHVEPSVTRRFSQKNWDPSVICSNLTVTKTDWPFVLSIHLRRKISLERIWHQ